MALNYARRLQNLQNRRFDPTIQKSILSESFSKLELPEDLKYLAESMMPIGNTYNEKTITAANNVKAHLDRDLQTGLSRAYRYQGSVMTNTNIKTYSDIDLLTIIDSYYYPEVHDPNNVYSGDADSDINQLRKDCVKILESKYDEVDSTGSKSISIYNKNLKRKVDIIICYWYQSEKYKETQDEYYKGVFLYDFDLKKRIKKDYPFAHIRQVDIKGNATNDGFRRGVRLLKNLKADSEDRITLSSFQLTSIVFSMSDAGLQFSAGYELSIAENISSHLNKLISEPTYRFNVKSPTGIEYPLKDESVSEQLKELKKDLDQLIIDCKSDLRNNYFEKSLRNYL